MRQFVTAAFLAMATMTASSSVQAKPPSGGQSGQSNHSQGQSNKGQIQKDMHKGDFKSKDFKSGKFDSFKNYHIEHGKKFSQGFYYSGKDHFHWSFCCYWPRYSCDCYYCPSACCWYYYCEPRCCYLPVTCVEYAPPVTTEVIVQNTNTNTAVAVNNNGSPGDLPPVLPVGPTGAGPVQPYKVPPMKP